MSDPTNDYNVQITISVISGIILLISEVLPFIKSVKSNGLLELIIHFIKKVLKKNGDIALEDEEALLGEENTFGISASPIPVSANPVPVSANPVSVSLTTKIDSLNTSVMNISYALNNYMNEAQNSRQLKLQSIELYELNYIINYIKVNYPKKMFQTRFLSKTNKQLLISQGYVIDYDSQNDTHTIKW
jgi:hypothetical protein